MPASELDTKLSKLACFDGSASTAAITPEHVIKAKGQKRLINKNRKNRANREFTYPSRRSQATIYEYPLRLEFLWDTPTVVDALSIDRDSI